MCYMIFFYQKRENWQLMGKLLWREEKEDGRLGELGSAFWWYYCSLQGGGMEGVEETVTLEDERWINQILSGLSVDRAYYPELSENVRLGRYAQGDGSRMYLLYDGTKGRLYVIESFL